jgi:hypothetical protein
MIAPPLPPSPGEERGRDRERTEAWREGYRNAKGASAQIPTDDERAKAAALALARFDTMLAAQDAAFAKTRRAPNPEPAPAPLLRPISVIERLPTREDADDKCDVLWMHQLPSGWSAITGNYAITPRIYGEKPMTHWIRLSVFGA